MGDSAAANLSAGSSAMGGGEKVGYLTPVSPRNVANSVGEDLMMEAGSERFESQSSADKELRLPESLIEGRPESSRDSFFTRCRSLMPPRHVNSVFQKSKSSYIV